MSRLNEKYQRRSQQFYDPNAPLSEQVQTLIEDGLHGICFSPYTEDQGPGDDLDPEQIKQRLSVVSPYFTWVRTFSVSQGNELIPGIAKSLGLKTMVGVWLDENHEKNAEEIATAIAMAKDGLIDLLAVGNEVMLREEMSDDQLVGYLEQVKAAVPDVPVGYVDAYYLFENFPKVADACDVIFTNCYPFWEGYSIDHAHVYMKDMYYRASAVAKGKPVIISETGWPNQGTATGLAEPSEENAMKYFIQTATWTKAFDIPLFYFSSFDEEWKVHDEGDVGAFWGLWDKNGTPKFYK